MRIAIVAPGSRGDVQPYLGLGQGLVRRGHQVRLVTTQDFEALVTAHGLEPVVVPFDVEAALRGRQTQAAIEGGGLLRSFRELARLGQQLAGLLQGAALEAARNADLVVTGLLGTLAASSAAETRGLPVVGAFNLPLHSAAEFPGVLLPGLSFPPRALSHRVSHWLTRQLVWQVARASGNGPRVAQGLPPASLLAPFDRPPLSRSPLLYGFSAAMLPRPADWDERLVVTGPWQPDEPEGWTPPEELSEFLSAGPPPVYVGFGSMSSESPAEVLAMVLEALRQTGLRAVVHRGWAGLDAPSVPATVKLVGSVPHRWLFPRVSAVVHHGGAGTTATAAGAGVPQVVVPFHGDQPFWAALTQRLGVGTAPIPRKRLTVARLAKALRAATETPSLRVAAAELASRMAGERGVERAVEVLTQLGAGR